MAYDPTTGMDDGYSYSDFKAPSNFLGILEVWDRNTNSYRPATDNEYRIWQGFGEREAAYRADQTSRGYGTQTQGGGIATSTQGAPLLNVAPARPNYQSVAQQTPATPAPSAPTSFSPQGTVDYSAQNSLENSLKKAARQGLNRNLEHGFRLAPKPQKKSGILQSFQ